MTEQRAIRRAAGAEAGRRSTPACCTRRRARSGQRIRSASTAASARAPKFPHPMDLRLLLRALAALRRRRRAATWSDTTLDNMAHGRHLRSPRRRLPSLQHRRALARAAFREDALRQRPARASPISKPSRPRGDAFYRADRRGDARLRAARDDQSRRGRFTARRTPTAKARKGKFFVWSHAEVESVLRPRETERLQLRLRRQPRRKLGGEEHSPSPQNARTRIAHARHGCGRADADAGGTRDASYLAVRASACRPGRDEKVLTAWNGLMLNSLAKAAAAGRAALCSRGAAGGGFLAGANARGRRPPACERTKPAERPS